MLLALGLPPAQAQAPVAPEPQVKAAYLVNFPGFVEWPPEAFRDAASALVIGWVGAEPVVQELQALVAARRVLGRPVELRPVTQPAQLAELHLLFVGAQSRRDGTELIAACRTLPVLVVTEAAWGLAAGAMLNFVSRDGTIRFEASRTNAERAGLKLSARLLRIAERVVDTP